MFRVFVSTKRTCKRLYICSLTAQEYRDELTRDSFVNGLSSLFIRQRLLENDNLNLARAFQLAVAQRQATSTGATTSPFMASSPTAPAASPSSDTVPAEKLSRDTLSVVKDTKCYFCGGLKHLEQADCPAKNAVCYGCGKRGHFAKVCKSKRVPSRSCHTSAVSALHDDANRENFVAPVVAGAPSCFAPSTVKATLRGKEI